MRKTAIALGIFLLCMIGCTMVNIGDKCIDIDKGPLFGDKNATCEEQ